MGRRKKETRGRPRSRFFPTTTQYKQMVAACAIALASHEKFIIVIMPNTMRVDGMEFPRRDPTGEPDTYRINARKLLDWLFARGHSQFDAKTLINVRFRVSHQITTMERSLDKALEKDDNDGTKEGENDGLL